MAVEQFRKVEFPWLPKWLPENADPFGYPDSLVRARLAVAYQEGIARAPVAGRRVLDYGSLNGHGVLRLALEQPEIVVSSDRHRDRLQEQQQVFDGSANLRFVNLEAPDVPFQRNTFDVIFFSHVIEHINEEKLPQLLANLKCVLRPDGVLIVATPSVDNLVAPNPTDEKVYSYEELESLLSMYFEDVTMLSLVPNNHASAVHERKKFLARFPGARTMRDYLPRRLQEIVLGSGEKRVTTEDFIYVEGYDSCAIDFLALVKDR